jgi:enamine deaminase RidA (YjgF/YER057c/UK114 family)
VSDTRTPNALPMWITSVVIAAMAIAACAPSPRLQRLNPPDLPPSRDLYTHVVVVESGRLVFVAGEVALDSAGGIVGAGDFRAQARQTYRNVERALRAAGAGWEDVVKTTTYVTDTRELPALLEVRREFIKGAPPPNTLLQVVKLARDELVIEVDAIAVVRR